MLNSINELLAIAKIRFRRDKTENWQKNKDVIPEAGEPCFDVDLSTLKIGDGDTPYDELKSFRTDTVLYSEQDLDEEEKIVARKNIGAEPIYGGLTKKTVTYTYASSERTMDIYIENGDISQPGEDATDEEKDAFAGLCAYFFSGVIPSNLEGYINLCQFPVKLWKSGYILSDTIAYAEPEKKHVFSMKLLDAKNGQHSIVHRIDGTLNMVAYYYSSTDTFNEGGTYEKNIKSSSYRAGTPLVYNLDVPAPSRDTSAVPKSYVDDIKKGDVFEVNISLVDGEYTADKTVADISNAIGSGLDVVVRIDNDKSIRTWRVAGDIYTITYMDFNGDLSGFRLYQTRDDSGNVTGDAIEVMSFDSDALGIASAAVGQTIKVKSVDSTGRPIAWETVDTVQPDWNQNDESADDYIKNRTHFWVRELAASLEPGKATTSMPLWANSDYTGAYKPDKIYVDITFSDGTRIIGKELLRMSVNEYGRAVYGDESVNGFRFEKDSTWYYYAISADKAATKCYVYTHKLGKKLDSEFLPLPDTNTRGGVRASPVPNDFRAKGWIESYVDTNGFLYTRPSVEQVRYFWGTPSDVTDHSDDIKSANAPFIIREGNIVTVGGYTNKGMGFPAFCISKQNPSQGTYVLNMIDANGTTWAVVYSGESFYNIYWSSAPLKMVVIRQTDEGLAVDHGAEEIYGWRDGSGAVIKAIFAEDYVYNTDLTIMAGTEFDLKKVKDYTGVDGSQLLYEAVFSRDVSGDLNGGVYPTPSFPLLMDLYIRQKTDGTNAVSLGCYSRRYDVYNFSQYNDTENNIGIEIYIGANSVATVVYSTAENGTVPGDYQIEIPADSDFVAALLTIFGPGTDMSGPMMTNDNKIIPARITTPSAPEEGFTLALCGTEAFKNGKVVSVETYSFDAPPFNNEKRV